MKEYNNGVKKENEAGNIFRGMFDYVEQTKHNKFYDYLVRKGTSNLLIEVKWVECRYKTAGIYLRWNQLMKLFHAKDFMLYILTSKGNFFISPPQLLEYAHIHFNKLNPNEKQVLITAQFDGKQFHITSPVRCLNCLGFLSDFIKV